MIRPPPGVWFMAYGMQNVSKPSPPPPPRLCPPPPCEPLLGDRCTGEEGFSEGFRLLRPHLSGQARRVLDTVDEPVVFVLGAAQSRLARVLFLPRGETRRRHEEPSTLYGSRQCDVEVELGLVSCSPKAHMRAFTYRRSVERELRSFSEKRVVFVKSVTFLVPGQLKAGPL